MKPTKNKIFCPGCNHPKMLFRSQEEAGLFLKYNASNIEDETGRRPVRIYFCRFCGGWHVTSKRYSFNYSWFLERFGVVEGERLYNLIKPCVKPGNSLEKGVMDKIKVLKRMLRHVTIDVERCRLVVNEISEILGAVFKTQIMNMAGYERLLGRFMSQVEIFTNKQGFN